MLNSKFDINSPEWIDRVFENRNKSYGAYDLRKHYAGNLFKAFAITILSIVAIIVVSYLLSAKPASVNIKKGAIDVINKPIKVTPATEPKKTTGTTTQSATTTTPAATNTKPLDALDADAVDVKPTPFGGAAAWAKFLENNLHYPTEAFEQRLTGTVTTSFIVERDGHISGISIDSPAGHGFDEEALRVLKLSPPWSTGKQNGQSVRVKYSLPINFLIQKK